MNKKALDDYDTLEWDSAKKTLLRRPGRRQEGGPRKPPGDGPDLRPPGRGLHHRLQEQQKGIQSFHRALEIDPAIQRRKGMATPELNDVFARGQPRCWRRRRGRRAAAEPPPVAGAVKRAAPSPPRLRGSGRRRRAPIRSRSHRRRPSRSTRRIRSRISRRASTRSSARPRTRRRPIGRCTIRCALAPNLPVTKLSPALPRARQRGFHAAADGEDAQGLVRRARSPRRR